MSLTLALLQWNPELGAVAQNAERLQVWCAEAKGVDVVITPEQYLTGYPLEDALLEDGWQGKIEAAVTGLAGQTRGGPDILLGTPWFEDGKLYNAALHLSGGEVQGKRYKHNLAMTEVYDEQRTFTPGPLMGPLCVRGVRVGALICEDMWHEEVPECLMETGSEFLVSMNGSVYARHKEEHHRMPAAVQAVRKTGLNLVHVNQVGGVGELVFDGAGFVMDSSGKLVLRQPSFREDEGLCVWDDGKLTGRGASTPPLESIHELYTALVLGLREYCRKSGFSDVLLGVSGGVDSALCATLAVDALGSDRVQGVMLPGPFTAQISEDDAATLGQLLGIGIESLTIGPMLEACAQALSPHSTGVAYENMQARLRALVLMTQANSTGALLLATGNKSEYACGYATLYGDMCGGFAPIKDIYKTEVYALCHWRNTHHDPWMMGPKGAVIPERILTRAPSAELAPDQRDDDALPPYDVLDGILEGLLHGGCKDGDSAEVALVRGLLDKSEHKRHQAPPGTRVSAHNFGKGRRYPVLRICR